MWIFLDLRKLFGYMSDWFKKHNYVYLIHHFQMRINYFK